MTGQTKRLLRVGALMLLLTVLAAVLVTFGDLQGQKAAAAPSFTAVSPAGIKLKADSMGAFVETVAPPAAADQSAVLDRLLQLPRAEADKRETLLADLEAMGIYEYTGQPVTTSALHTPQVLLAPPAVFYNSVTGEWYVLCGGQWLDTAWTSGLPHGDLKGPDGFGVLYEFMSGYTAHVVDARAVMWNEDRTSRVTTDYRASGDGSKGFDFTLQDKLEADGFLGHSWAGVCVYSPEFADCTAELTAYYRHD